MSVGKALVHESDGPLGTSASRGPSCFRGGRPPGETHNKSTALPPTRVRITWFGARRLTTEKKWANLCRKFPPISCFEPRGRRPQEPRGGRSARLSYEVRTGSKKAHPEPEPSAFSASTSAGSLDFALEAAASCTIPCIQWDEAAKDLRLEADHRPNPGSSKCPRLDAERDLR